METMTGARRSGGDAGGDTGCGVSLRCRLADLLLNCARIGFNP